jgi:hypothetical protein
MTSLCIRWQTIEHLEGGSDEQQTPTGSLSLSLSLSVIGLLAPPAEAAKVTLEKQEIFSDDGELLGFRDFTAAQLDSLAVDVIADYPTFVAGEVDDGDVAAFEQTAADQGFLFALHPEWDVIALNGYSFPSAGPPLGLPPDLQIPGFDGETGLYLVQLKAPPAAGWREVLARVGEVVGYYPWNTYLMRFPPNALPTVRALGFVQHVSPYQPAYKISTNIPDADQPVDVVVVLDGGQDLTQVIGLLESYGAAGLGTLAGESRGVVQVAVDRIRLRTLAGRVEVLWVEPQYEIEFSGERDASIVAGQYDAEVPPQRPIRYSGGVGGHEGWLRAKGFCTPTYLDPGCMYYWTKVGVFDHGLDTTICLDYDEQTGVCSEWHPDNLRHPDLNHNSNLWSNCPPPGEGIEADDDCDGPVIYERVFCSDSLIAQDPPDPPLHVNQCFDGDNEWYDFSDKPEELVPWGHGTSVASVIVGDPLDEPNPEIDPAGFYRGTGVAPSAQVLLAKFTALAHYHGDLTGKMTHERWSDMVAQVRTAGHSSPDWLNAVRFANNSWNVVDHYDQVDEAEYTLFSRMADKLVRDAIRPQEEDPPLPPNGLQEMTLVFSAGNCPSWEDDCPTRSPGNAKNVISVGATRGWSEDDSVPVHLEGELAPLGCYATSHHISDIAGYVTWQGDAAGNSRRRALNEPEAGPRYKPDLVAPGSQVAAALSSQINPWTPYLCFMGTSAAAPAVTGAAVLAEAWYWHTFGNVLPSPAMIKAMLVAHADDLHDGFDHLVSSELPHSPSHAQGWGRVNLDTLIPDSPALPAVVVFDQDHGTAGRRFTQTGQYWSTQLQVLNPDDDIIAVLVFTDKESQENAANLMVNDLDLKLTKIGLGSQSHTFQGNQFATGSWYSRDYGINGVKPPKDAYNTVEVIRVPAGVLSGVFTIRVTAAAIVENAVPGLDGGADNQDFALYVHNATQ